MKMLIVFATTDSDLKLHIAVLKSKPLVRAISLGWVELRTLLDHHCLCVLILSLGTLLARLPEMFCERYGLYSALVYIEAKGFVHSRVLFIERIRVYYDSSFTCLKDKVTSDGAIPIFKIDHHGNYLTLIILPKEEKVLRYFWRLSLV